MKKSKAQKRAAKLARGKFYSARQKEYHAYIASPKWRAFRQKVLADRGFQCEICKAGVRLEVHHLTYERFGCELMGDVQALCFPCHKRKHPEKWGKQKKSRRPKSEPRQFDPWRDAPFFSLNL